VTYLDELLIEADGTVRIKHLTPELLDVALALDPTDARLIARRALLDGDAEEPPHE
jgi:hypothetical protein